MFSPHLLVVKDGLALVGVACLAYACGHQCAWAMVYSRDRLASGVHVLKNASQILVARPVPSNAVSACTCEGLALGFVSRGLSFLLPQLRLVIKSDKLLNGSRWGPALPK